MTTAGDPVLELREAGELVHALVGHRADALGIRMLVIKGPASRLQGLRPPGVSNDVDVWVDPERRDALVADLAAIGWERRDEYSGPDLIDRHSVTLWHRRWACEIDVHDRFPGFCLPPAELFARLWEARVPVEVAHRPLAAPRPDQHALLLALHALRYDGRVPAAAELSLLAAAVGRVLSPEQTARLGRTASDLGAADTAAGFIDLLDTTPHGRGGTDPADLALWRLVTGADSLTSVAWVSALRRAPWRQRPALLWRAVWLPRAEIEATQKRTLSSAELRAYRRRRLRRGVRALPRALRTLRS